MLVPFLLPPGCGEEEVAAILKYANGQHLYANGLVGLHDRRSVNQDILGLPQSSDYLSQMLYARKLSFKHVYTSVIGGFCNSKGRSIHD